MDKTLQNRIKEIDEMNTSYVNKLSLQILAISESSSLNYNKLKKRILKEQHDS